MTVEETEDDVAMAEYDSDVQLPADELAEAEPEMEEGGEPSSIDPLVVKGIKWTIVDNTVDICYIPSNVGKYYGTEHNNWILRVVEGNWISFCGHFQTKQ